MLLHLISDFIRQPALREQFLDQSDEGDARRMALFATYGLSDEAIQIALREDLDEAVKFVEREMRDHFPKNFSLKYPGEPLVIESVAPTGVAVGKRVVIEVMGRNLDGPGRKYWFENDDGACDATATGNQRSKGPGHDVVELEAHFVRPGVYDLRVNENDGPGWSVLPRAITVVA